MSVRHDERYWYPDEGGQVWVAGYSVVDADGRYLARDALPAGLYSANVAGAAAHHGEALQSAGAAPGSALTLRRDPANAHDANAIAVLTAGGATLGFVPRELAAELAPELDTGTEWGAVVLRERRDSPRDPRTGLTMLLARGGTPQLGLPGGASR